MVNLYSLKIPIKADFGSLQVRGRMRSQNRIEQKAKLQPCHLLIFDLLEIKGKDMTGEPYLKRKKELNNLFTVAGLPDEPDEKNMKLLQMIPLYRDFQTIWEQVILHNGEGIVAKHENNRWEEGKRSVQWLKYKNWKYVSCFITAYEKTNGYFYISVYKGEEIYPIGLFLFGLTSEAKQALTQIIKDNQTDEDQQFIYVSPAICVEVKYLEIYEGPSTRTSFPSISVRY